MEKNRWLWLQLFAGEGAGASGGGEGGGEGASAGENNGLAAGDQRLLELGVPEEKLRKRAKRASAKLPEGAVRTAPKEAQEQKPQEQVATAEGSPTEENAEAKAEAPAKKSFKEILEDPEYNAQMQAIVRSRVGEAKKAEEAMAKLNDALEVLALKHGLDPANIDYDALAKAIGSKDEYIDDLALDKGLSRTAAESEVESDLDRARKAKAEQRERDQLMEKMKHEHMQNLFRQGEELKKVFPKFDLNAEMQNPSFRRMLAPGQGLMSVEDAYRAVHRKEIEAAQSQVIAKKTAQQISNSIQAGARRPDENGTSGQSPSVTSFSYAKASKEQRDALKKAIHAAKARGEKLYPGR